MLCVAMSAQGQRNIASLRVVHGAIDLHLPGIGLAV